MDEIERLITGLKPGGVDLQGWLILADALEEAGRQEEADLIRSDRNCKPVGNRIVECGWCERCQEENCKCG